MKVGDAIAEILKREGVDIIFGYPVNHVLESAAAAGIRPIIVRQERVGLHMADALSRLTSGRRIGVFAMQHGPGSENAFGGVAQAYGESVPILVLPMGYARRLAYIDPNFNSVASMRSVTKSAEPIMAAAEIPNIFRRAFSRLRNGRGGPALVEIPLDLFAEEMPEPWAYEPVISTRYGPDTADVRRAAAALVDAKKPRDLRGTGNSLRARVGFAQAARGIAGRTRRDELAGQERVSGGSSARARRWRQRFSAHRSAFSREGGLDFRRRLQLHGDGVSASPCRPGRSSFTRRSIRIT